MARVKTSGESLADRPVAGESWDMIAKRAYGDERYTAMLFDANPGLLDRLFFDGTESVVVPIVASEGLSDELPPWKVES